jgi:hypothetical protein
VREVVEPLEYEDRLDMEETPEMERLDRKLELSGVARRFGDCEGDLEGTTDSDRSKSVDMTMGTCTDSCQRSRLGER